MRVLFEAVAALGQHAGGFATNQDRHGSAIQALTQQIEQLTQFVSNIPQAAPRSGTSRGAIKSREPRMFNGKVSEVVPFLRGDGSPVAWYNSLERRSPHLLRDWTLLQREFRTRFEDPNLVRTSLRKLEALKQTGSAANYANQFQELLAHLDLTDFTQITYFDRGLKPALKHVLVNTDRPQNLDDWISTVTVADNRLHDLEREQKTSTDVIPMEIDAIRPNMSEAAKKKLKAPSPSGKA
ncbi:hypothetical protein IEO21_03852 [Rhodonia placenta]|uniref:Retrotransposon gag domain-containing protein n=1 Tax=Rhodonia placenta TaxID=104341 RepID=A0A8H7U352_9APHY|nr:hypothetical protein IEO21_03852 [Postia placenta]